MSEVKRLPLIADVENRGVTTTVDARLVNGFVEKQPEGDYRCYKRPAYILYDTIGGGSSGGNGLFSWNEEVYSVYDGTLYKEGSSLGSILSQNYDFDSCLGATPKLFIHGPLAAYVYDSGGGIVQVTDGDYPAITVPGCAYLDGTMYVMTPECYILGSDINTPTAWNPLNSILAQIEPDIGVALAKQMSYIVAFKGNSTEIFYDAGNASGSPLGRVEAAKVNYGCHNANTVVDADGSLFWVAQAPSGVRSVAMMENLKAHIVSTPAIDRLLHNYSFTDVRAQCLYGAGHRFYCLSFPTDAITLAYDMKERIWYEWHDTAGDMLPFAHAAHDVNHDVLVQERLGGRLFKFSSDTYSDVDGDFDWSLFTPVWDGGTRLRKMVHRLEVAADQQLSPVIQVYYSDDDYQNWSAGLDLDLSLESAILPNMGSFRKRAHWFFYRGNKRLRVQAVDLHVDLGTL